MPIATALLAQLTRGAQNFARAILATHPEWSECARLEQNLAGQWFIVDLPSPYDASRVLRILVDEDEITVFFDRWHGHFEAWSETPEEEGSGNAREFVESILSEQLAVAVKMRGDKWLAAQTLRPDQILPPPSSDEWIYVRSWSGTRDEEVRGRDSTGARA